MPTKLVANTRELKAVAVWYQLKSLRVGGVIKNFGQNARAIATSFGYSERKLRTYVAYLITRGYIEKLNRHDLALRASKKLGKEYGVSKTYYRIPSDKLHQLELEIRALALRENTERQAHALKNKLKEKYLRDNGIQLSSHLQPAAKRRLLRGFSLAKAQVNATTHFVSAVQNPGSKPEINPFITLSRQGIARALSRKSKSTGLRYATKLRAAGLLADKPHHIVICDATLQEYGFMREGGYDHTFRFIKGQVIKALSNQLIILPSVWAGDDIKKVPVIAI